MARYIPPQYAPRSPSTLGIFAKSIQPMLGMLLQQQMQQNVWEKRRAQQLISEGWKTRKQVTTTLPGVGTKDVSRVPTPPDMTIGGTELWEPDFVVREIPDTGKKVIFWGNKPIKVVDSGVASGTWTKFGVPVPGNPNQEMLFAMNSKDPSKIRPIIVGDAPVVKTLTGLEARTNSARQTIQNLANATEFFGWSAEDRAKIEGAYARAPKLLKDDPNLSGMEAGIKAWRDTIQELMNEAVEKEDTEKVSKLKRTYGFLEDIKNKVMEKARDFAEGKGKEKDSLFAPKKKVLEKKKSKKKTTFEEKTIIDYEAYDSNRDAVFNEAESPEDVYMAVLQNMITEKEAREIMAKRFPEHTAGGFAEGFKEPTFY